MSLEAPVSVKSKTIKVTRKIPFLSLSTRLVLTRAREKRDDFFSFASVFLSKIKTVGKTIKEMSKDRLFYLTTFTQNT